MIDQFKAIYKILSAFEKSLDLEEFNPECVSPEVLGVSRERWEKYIQMLSEKGYISGVEITKYVTGSTRINLKNACLTLDGLAYLAENSIMQKIYKTTMGIKELIK